MERDRRLVGRFLFLATTYDIIAKLVRYTRCLYRITSSLRSCSTTPRCSSVTRVAVLAHRTEVRRWMIRPYVRGLHAIIAILAIGNGVSRNILHKSHFSHTAARIFDKEVCRIKLSDKP